MRTAEEIKRGLEHCCNDAPCVECEYYDQRDRRYTCEDALLADALAYIQQLEMLAKPSEQVRWERDVAIDQLKQLGVGFGEKVEAQVPKWISVDERLPEEFVDVLVYRDGCYAKSCITSNEPINGLVWSYTGIGGNPTHWMPLPEPPKEG